MRERMRIFLGSALLLLAGYFAGSHHTTVAYAGAPAPGVVPKSYGRLVTAIPDSIGTGLIFED